jgi:hypothetical protein
MEFVPRLLLNLSSPYRLFTILRLRILIRVVSFDVFVVMHQEYTFSLALSLWFHDEDR